MGLLDSLLPRSTDQHKHIADLAETIAQRACSAVWGRVHRRAIGMPAAEARGYIRAHASVRLLPAVVKSAMAARRTVGVAHLSEVAELAKDKVVEKLLREIVRVRETTADRRLAA